MKRKLDYFLFKPSDSIHKAMKHLGALGIVLVVDEKRRLLGSITNGDVRRALLDRADLDRPVEAVMNTDPLTARAGTSVSDLLDAMVAQEKMQIPIVDETGRVADIVCIEDLLRRESRSNLVCILAGGQGKRLHPLTEKVPKSMLHVGEKPILQTIVEQLRFQGFRNLIISVFHNAEAIKDYFGDGRRFGVDIAYTREDMPLGTAGPLSRMPRQSDLPLIVLNGDLLAKINFGAMLASHCSGPFDITIGIRSMGFKLPFGVVELDGARVTAIEEKPTKDFNVSAGVYVINPDVVREIAPDRHYDMPELIEDAMAAGRPVGGHLLEDYWLDIGTHEKLEQAQREYGQFFQE